VNEVEELLEDSQRFRFASEKKKRGTSGKSMADDSTTTGSRERASRTAIAAMTQERERVMEGANTSVNANLNIFARRWQPLIFWRSSR